MSEHLPMDETHSMRGHPDPREAAKRYQERHAASQPKQIGPYKILQILGEGGMGIVYLAEQEKPIRRRVALKLIKLGMDTKEVIVRFEAEREALAMMNHPNVARVFDAGATETGRPYFVMEYVQGQPITRYCDQQRLSVNHRLELFTQVCQAVQHAHQRGIIHRDLKPSNVLVAEDDPPKPPLGKGGFGGVKVIDFGIAKATQHRLTQATLFTEQGMMVGTPAYMSPEQADPGAQDIDTRTDVYSLGVILYELLVGMLPFEPKTLQASLISELQRIIRDVDPPRPSTRIRSMQSQAGEPRASARADAPSLDASETPDNSLVPNSARAEARGSLVQLAHHRATEPRSLYRHIRGDLDWIVMKCLEKDRARRYDSPNEIAADIQRYLAGDAVIAAPPSTTYRLRKFIRRNKGSVIAGTLVAATLLLGVIGTTVGLVQARRQQGEAQTARDEAETVTVFLSDMLAAASPGKQGKDVLVREVLDRATKQIAAAFVNRPRVEARLRETMGSTYLALGLYPNAQTEIESAYDLSRRELGDLHEQTLRAASLRGRVLFYIGEYDNAEKELTQIIETAKKHLGPDHAVTLEAQDSLILVYANQGRKEEAERLCRMLLETRTRVQGPEHEETIGSMNSYAMILMDMERYDEAEELFGKTLEIERRVLGDEHPGTLTTMTNLAETYKQQSRYEDAVRLGEQVLETCRRVLGPEHEDTLTAENNLAGAYRGLGLDDKAEPLFLHDLDVSRRVLGPEHPDTLISMTNIAKFYLDTGQPEKAEPLFAESVAGHIKHLPPGFFGTGLGLLGHGMCLNALDRSAEAEPKLLEAYAILSKEFAPESGNVRRTIQELVATYDKLGLPEKSAEWKERLKKK